MGVSTDAKLFFGVLVVGVDEDETEAARALGFIKNDQEFAEGDGIQDFELPAGLEWESTGHCDGCLAVYAAAKGGLSAYRGGDVEVKALPKVSDAQRKKLEAIAEQVGNDVGYFLAPYTDF